MLDNIKVEYDTMIPNNVGLSSDKKVLKALERWPVSYTHLRAHETREDLVWRGGL